MLKTLSSFEPGVYQVVFVSLITTDGTRSKLGIWKADLRVVNPKSASRVDLGNADLIGTRQVTGPLELVDYAEIGLPHATEGRPYFEFYTKEELHERCRDDQEKDN